MKRYILIAAVVILVLAVVGIAKSSSAWASLLPASTRSGGTSQLAAIGVDVPPAAIVNISGSGIYNVGGVCTVEVDLKANDVKINADAEVPVAESRQVPYSGEGKLFFPGCHIVPSKQNVVVSPLSTNDGSAKVCFGASPEFQLTINYYLDTPDGGNRTWIPLPTTLEDNGRTVCAPAQNAGVYMPAGVVPLIPVTGTGEGETIPPEGVGGSVVPPAPEINVTASGTYPVGGICIFTANYNTSGLSDTISVKYDPQDTLNVPSADVTGLFYFPGCQVVHYKDQAIQPEVTTQEGNWQICFAAIPNKTMTIYYYRDDLTTVTPPWVSLPTTTQNGVACADPVNFTAVYVPVGN